MLTKEQANRIADGILYQEVEQRHQKIAQQVKSIPWMHRCEALNRVPAYQQYTFYKQAKKAVEKHSMYKHVLYTNIIIIMAVSLYFTMSFNKVNNLSDVKVVLFLMVFLVFSSRIYQSNLIKKYLNQLIKEHDSKKSIN